MDRSLFENRNDSEKLNDVNHSLYQNRNESGELDSANNTIASIKLLNDFDLEGDSLPDVTVLSNSDLDDMIYEKIKHLPDIYRERLHKTLKTNNVSLTSTYSVPCAKTKIDLQFKSDIPRNTKIYSIPKDQKKIVYSTLQYLLFNGIIRRADPDKNFGSPIFPVLRKDGKIRILVDMRNVNKSLLRPITNSLVDAITQVREIASNAKFISSIDLSNMFYSFKFADKVIDSGYANVITPWGAFVMLRAITGSSAVPSYANSEVFRNLHLTKEGKHDFLSNVVNFFDDTTLYSSEWEGLEVHVDKLCKVIERFSHMGFMINLSKCKLCIDSYITPITILGYNIYRNQLSVPSNKYKTLVDCISVPNTVKDLQRILGTLNFFRSLFKTKSLNALHILASKMNENTLKWDDEGDAALEILRSDINEGNLCIAVPDRHCVNLITTDASNLASGVVLEFIRFQDIDFSCNEIDFKNYELSDRIIKHCSKFKMQLVGQSKVYNRILDCTDYILQQYDGKLGNKNQTINLLKRAVPSVEYAYLFQGNNEAEQYGKFDELFTALLNNDCKNEYSTMILLLMISSYLSRQILIINEDYEQCLDFMKIGENHLKSSIIISAGDKKFQLLALTKEYNNVKSFNNASVENMSGEAILRMFNKGRKKGIVNFGGVYHKKFDSSIAKSSINVKELNSILIGLTVFENEIKLCNTVLATDNNICKETLKSSTLNDVKKLNRLAIALQTKFPMIKIVYVKSKENVADTISRCYTMEQFLENTLKKTDLTKVGSIQHKETIEFLEQNVSFHKIATRSLIELTHLFENKDFTIKNNVVLKDDKIVLPKSMYWDLILVLHYKNGHVGRDKIKKIIYNSYHILDKTELSNQIDKLNSSCRKCLLYKPNNAKLLQGSRLMNNMKVGECIVMDFLEFDKTTSSTNFNLNYILVIGDLISRKISCYYAPKMNQSFVISSLMSYFGEEAKVKFIVSDNASYFRGRQLIAYLKFMNIKLLQTSPSRPAAHGFVESKVKVIRDTLKLVSNDSHSNKLVLYGPLAQNIINNRIIDNSTPNLVHFAGLHIDEFGSDYLYSMLSEENFNKLKELNLAAEKNIQHARKKDLKVLKRKNKYCSKHKFEINDLVLPKVFTSNKAKKKFNDIPHRVIKCGKFTLSLENILTHMVIIRHVKDVKKLKILFSELPTYLHKNQLFFTEKYLTELKNPLSAVGIKKTYNLRNNTYLNEGGDEYSDDSDDLEVSFAEIT